MSFLNSCTQYDNPGGDFQERIEKVDTTIQRKVLWINLEGASGKIVKEVMPSTIENMLPNSKYTWEGLSENLTTDATTWASLTTGVNMDKHRIRDDTFIPATSLNSTQDNLPFFPTVFYNVNEVNPSMKSLTISSWDPLSDVLFAHADSRVDVETDEEVKDSAVSRLKNTNPDLTLVSFRNILEAGKKAGFSAQNTDYVSAIHESDKYISNLWDAIKSRESFAQENWLIIITSNHGGKERSYGGNSELERNTLSIFYNSDYEGLELGGEKLLTNRFDQNLEGEIPDLKGMYSREKNTEMTIEFFMRLNPDEDGDYNFNNWDKILGKGRWGIYRQRSDTKLYMTGDGWGLEKPVRNSFTDGKWHSMVVSMKDLPEENSQTVKMYYDGAMVYNETLVGSLKQYEDFSPIEIGGTYVYFNLAELRIWDKALSDFQVAENACLMEITSSHREYEHLIGYWPGQEESEVLQNRIDEAPNLHMLNDTTFFSNSSNNLPCDLGSANVNVENVSIVPQIYYWLGISINSDWNLDNDPFLDRFELELSDF